jgi:glycosyltransferase involved in cell wall biosynthesis
MKEQPIKVSVVIPSLNEERNISRVVKAVQAAFHKFKINGEVVIMDSSTDKTPEIARKLGAQVYQVPKKGLGFAYIESLKYVKGDYVVMGDADGTYNFLEINRFVKKLDEGYDFVMGTRLKGDIKKGAMPWSHRYIGTPILTLCINLLFKTKISDCNSGLRALTKDAFKKIRLESKGWEYASEMVVKAALNNLKIAEVPVSLTPDQNGRRPRLSNPFQAGWSNLRYILLLASEVIFLQIGFVMWLLGTLLVLSQARGAITIFNIFIGLHTLILGLILSFLGLFIIQMGLLSQMFSYISAFKTNSISQRIKRWFTFDKGIVMGSFLFAIGAIMELIVLIMRIFYYTPQYNYFYLALYGMYFIINGVMVIYFGFIFSLFNRQI